MKRLLILATILVYIFREQIRNVIIDWCVPTNSLTWEA